MITPEHPVHPRIIAWLSGQPDYLAECKSCGNFGAMLTADGKCLSCGKTERYAAIWEREPYYHAICPTHGMAAYHTARNKCSLCFTSQGFPRAAPRDLTSRVEARHLGAKSYLAVCPTHGEVPHDTIRGKCLRCFTTQGYPRLGSRPDNTVRREARAAGNPTYLHQCPNCGTVPHSTNRGKCLTCFTSTGFKRRSSARIKGDPNRAAARLAGENSYLAVCPTHGEVPHDTIRGKCLTCFTTLGAPRKRPA